MNRSLWDEFKYGVMHSGNRLYQLLAANIILFAVLGLTFSFLYLFTGTSQTGFARNYLYLPDNFPELAFKPWTLVSYMFLHSFSSIFHIIMNMLVLYWFGRIFREYLGDRKLLSTYFLGGFSGGIMFIIVASLSPIFRDASGPLVGASASVLAILVAAATLLPDYSIRLIIFGPVKLKYLALVIVFLDILGIMGSNPGGSIAHLGGALFGFIYVKQLQSGNDLGEWFSKILDFFALAFKPSPKKDTGSFKVHYGKKQAKKSSANTRSGEISQEVIDSILEKVSREGYDGLSQKEKDILFRASKQS